MRNLKSYTLLILLFVVFVYFSCDARFAVPQILKITVTPTPANPGDLVTIKATTAKGLQDTDFVRVDLTEFGL